jgi:hypothetical protein
MESLYGFMGTARRNYMAQKKRKNLPVIRPLERKINTNKWSLKSPCM